MPASRALVQIEAASKTFDPKRPAALEPLTAAIPAGQFVGIVGPDGAGKTTLIRLMAGLLKPTQGAVSVAGHDTCREPEEVRRLIGYMPQRFGLYEDLTVRQNLNLYADLRAVVGQERQATFARLLQFTGLEPFQQRLAGALSGGMKQKLGLACALIQKPTLLLLDEPSVGVDPISRRELWKMVHSLLEEQIAVVWSTAYLDEAEQCDTVLLLSDGKLLYQGPPAQLTQRVAGRSFLLQPPEGKRRQLLQRILSQPEVMDGVVQGSRLRLLTRDGHPPDVDLKPVAPRFEDAFVDILGGGPGGHSELADRTPEIQSNGKPVVVAAGLTKKFGQFVAVDNISFSVQRGEIFGLLGPNGAGKSTTFRMLCGLLQPTQGEASILGLDLRLAPGKARARIGYMAQKFSLYGNLTVKQNLRFFSGVYNLAGNAQTSAINQAIEIFHLEEQLNVATEMLPLGYKQRLALACATLHHPELLFLDEPTSGVDPIVRREFWNHINGLVEKGVTILVTTHFMDEAEYCDRIALIYRGQLIQLNTPDALKEMARSPEHPEPSLEDAFIQQIRAYDAA